MKPHDEPHGLCSIDPITLTGLALAGLAGGATAAIAGGGSSAAPPPAAPPAPTASAPPASNPVGQAKPSTPPQQQSFIGAAATPNTQSGSKTLLGQ